MWDAACSFLNAEGTIIDVRSPSEYARGHIPQALSTPLFSDDERAQVGICYKTQGQKPAVALGLELVAPKITPLLDQLGPGPIRVYCWRGGMRSGSVAVLLNTCNIPTTLLEGGYKTYRSWVHSQFERPWKLKVVGGLTGTGKTAFLHQLKKENQQVIDLEGLANHRGSAFGMLGMPAQPHTEHFQNLIGKELGSFTTDKTVWIEDESRMVGYCHLPPPLFHKMQESPLHLITSSTEERLNHLEATYGDQDPQLFIPAIQRITNKLGSEKAQKAINLISEGHFREAALIVLEYYDKTYTHHLNKRQ